jgi:hypothetical protein
VIRGSRFLFALGLVLVIAIAACTQETAWPKTAGETSCQEWTAQMRPLQRTAMGRAILVTLRGLDNNDREPADGLIPAYVNSITDVCRNTPDEMVSAVAATIYSLSPDLATR